MPRAFFPGGRKVLFLLVLLGVIGAAWWWVQPHPPPEPVYQGRRLSEWLTTRSPHPYEFFNHALFPCDELSAFGPDTIPWLAYMVEYGHTSFTRQGPLPFDKAPKWMRRWLPERWGGLHALPRGDEQIHAARALYSFGWQAAPAIPALTRGLLQTADSPEDLIDAKAEALNAIGPASWPAAQRVLQHGEPRSRRALLVTMSRRLRAPSLTPEADASDAFHALVEGCRDREAIVRAGAAQGISRCLAQEDMHFMHLTEADIDPAMTELAHLFFDPDAKVQLTADVALENCLPWSQRVIPLLAEKLDDRESSVRLRTINILRYLDLDGTRSSARVSALLHDPDEKCREAAAQTLAKFNRSSR